MYLTTHTHTHTSYFIGKDFMIYLMLSVKCTQLHTHTLHILLEKTLWFIWCFLSNVPNYTHTHFIFYWKGLNDLSDAFCQMYPTTHTHTLHILLEKTDLSDAFYQMHPTTHTHTHTHTHIYFIGKDWFIWCFLPMSPPGEWLSFRRFTSKLSWSWSWCLIFNLCCIYRCVKWRTVINVYSLRQRRNKIYTYGNFFMKFSVQIYYKNSKFWDR